MSKTKRINVIAKGKQILSELFNIKVRRINRTISSALDVAQENILSAKDEILTRVNKLGEAETDEQRQSALNSILEAMDEVSQWETRYSQVKKLQEMLDEEVEETED